MNCKFLWWNLPAQIKEKLGITLLYNWFRISSELNVLLRELEETKPLCYAEYFGEDHIVYWFNTISDSERICNILDCDLDD